MTGPAGKLSGMTAPQDRAPDGPDAGPAGEAPDRQAATGAAGGESGEGSEGGDESGEGGLDERQLRILAFERQWWRHAGAKEQAIRDTFDLSATRYYQLLNALLEHPAALAHDPMLVRRLRRLRAARVRRRARGSSGLSRGA
jgi:hypothetical protein